MIFCRILTYFVTGMDFKNPRSGQMNDFCMEILWPQMKKPKLRPQCPRLMSVLPGFFSPLSSTGLWPMQHVLSIASRQPVLWSVSMSSSCAFNALFHCCCFYCVLALKVPFLPPAPLCEPIPIPSLLWSCRSFFFRSHPRLIFCHRLQQVIKINGSHSACGLWRMRHKQSARSSFRG